MTNDQNAMPERIWTAPFDENFTHGEWCCAKTIQDCQQYIRADIHEAVVKELDEQCRLHGLGANREAKLIAERDALQRQLAQCRREALEECYTAARRIRDSYAAGERQAVAALVCMAIRELIEKEGGA